MTVSDAVSHFTLETSQIVGAASVFAVAFVLAVLGAVMFGKNRAVEADLFVGYGIATLVFVFAGATLALPLTIIAMVVAAVAIAGLIWRSSLDRTFIQTAAAWPLVWRVFVLGAPTLVLAAAMAVSQWDEFSQWIPNAIYLFRFDSFPRLGMPASPSVFPAYPYGLPLVTFAASRMVGTMIENAGGLFNILILLMLAPAYLTTVRRGLNAGPDWARSWWVAALGVLGVTVLTGTFVQKLVFTHYADTTTAAVLAMAGYLLWRLLGALAGENDDEDKPTALAWQTGFVFAALLFLKQTNPVLMALLLMGAGVVALRDPKVPFWICVKLLPAILLPALIVYLSWRYHVFQNISAGEFSFKPREAWLTDHIFTIFVKMLSIMSKKGAYFGVMAVLSASGIWALFNYRGAFSRISIMVAVVFLGYTVFLWAMYVIAFGDYEGMNAASFWRYNTQLGQLGALASAYGISVLWQRFCAPGSWSIRVSAGLGIAATIAVIAAPLAMSGKIRFDIRPQKTLVRTVGAELGRTLTEGSRVAVIDLGGNGITSTILKFELMSAAGAGRDLAIINRLNAFSPNRDTSSIRKFLADNLTATHIVILEPLAEVIEAVGVDLTPYAINLLARSDTGWRLVKSWPYPGYTEPHSLPD